MGRLQNQKAHVKASHDPLHHDYPGKNLRNAWDEAGLKHPIMSNPAGSLDFSMPWEFSDVVLLVEEDRFHVHRYILDMWSEVFSTMFTSPFKEKTAEEVPLPGKKSAEIKELLLVIYPTSAKPIDESNYTFLLDLAKEYIMAKITEKCESYLVGRLGSAESCTGACVCVEICVRM